MDIVVLQGSPNQKGSTALLVEEFARGAQSAGHAVKRIDVAYANVAPCSGCIACDYGSSPCVQHDGMEEVREALLSADAIVFATPLYYFGMTAQLKAVVDRFCADNTAIEAKRFNAALLTVGADTEAWAFEPLVEHYRALCRYLSMEDKGTVLGFGCGTPEETQQSSILQEAFALGTSLSPAVEV